MSTARAAYRSRSPARRLAVAGTAVVGLLLGWADWGLEPRALTLFVLLPTLALLAGILSTWSP